MLFNKTRTNSGFKLIEFTDLYDASCSIQESSLATEAALWLGVDDHPKVHTPGTGIGHEKPYWQPLLDVLPEGSTTTGSRIHLTQEMVEELLPVLEHFAKTGSLPIFEEGS